MSSPFVAGLRTHRVASGLLLLSLAIACYGAPTDIAIRSKGEVGVYNDPVDLIERASAAAWALRIGLGLVGATGPFIEGTCATSVAVPAVSVACIGLVVGFGVGSIITVVSAFFQKSDSEIALAIRSIGSDNEATKIMRSGWLAQFEATGKPVIVAHHDCHGPGCLQSEYSLHTTKAGKTYHRVLTGPHRENNGTNHLSVSPDFDPPETYYYQGSDTYKPTDYSTSNDNTYFMDYIFEMEDTASAQEILDGYNDNSEDEIGSFEGAVDTDYINTNGQGYYCMNIGSQAVPGVGMAGYAGFFQTVMEQDPDNEDSRMQQCSTTVQPDYKSYAYYGDDD